MTYKWTLSEIDKITWPQIAELLSAIKEHPPADLMVAAMFKNKEKEAHTIKNIPANIPVKRGKVGEVRIK